MEKIIKLSVSNNEKIEDIFNIIDFDFSGSDATVNDRIYEEIGNNCRVFQVVPPVFLHKVLNLSTYPRHKEEIGLALICDEEGKSKNNPIPNSMANVITLSGAAGDYIVGNCLVVATKYNYAGEVDICGIPDDILESIRLMVKERIELPLKDV